MRKVQESQEQYPGASGRIAPGISRTGNYGVKKREVKIFRVRNSVIGQMHWMGALQAQTRHGSRRPL